MIFQAYIGPRLRRIAIVFAFGVILSPPAVGQQPQVGGLARLQAWQQHLEMARTSPFRRLPWHAMGPKFAGGRVESIDAPRGDLATIYVGVGAGGVWKSSNAGLTWKHVFRNESTFAIGDITVAPSDPNTIWVGTGECHIGRMSFAGVGVYKSEDAGGTWTHLGLPESYHIGQIAIDPVNKDQVYVASMGQRGRGGQRGIFKTTDGGKKFRKVLDLGESVSLVDLVIDPADPRRLFASAWDRRNGGKGGVYRSEDQGESWQRLGKGVFHEEVGRVAIAVSTSNAGVVYALMTDRSSPALARRRPASILYRSDDSGRSWKRTHEGYVPTYVGWDFCDVRVAPDNEDRVYIGGFRLLVSHDGGETFVGEGGLAPNKSREDVFRLHAHRGIGLHLDVHDIWIDPEHPQRVMLGNDGGLFSSTDRGQTWLHHNNLPIAEFYRVHLDDQMPFRVWGGTQDNASLVAPSTARLKTGEDDAWQHVFLDPWSGGDGFATFPDPNDPQTVFYTQQNGDLKKAQLGKLSSGRRIRPRAPRGETELKWAWDTPFFASQHPGETVLYCAAQRVLRSVNAGKDWQAISPDLGTRGLLCLSESPVDPNRLVAGGGRGRIHLTSDGGKSWTESKGLPEKMVRDVVCSAHNPNRVYVALSGRIENDSASYVFVTHDFGKTWNPIAGDLPHEPVNAIAEDSKTDGLLFVGTVLGVYTSLDGGERWQSLCGTLPTAPVYDVEVHGRDGKLVAATHGLSVFILDIEPIRKAVPID